MSMKLRVMLEYVPNKEQHNELVKMQGDNWINVYKVWFEHLLHNTNINIKDIVVTEE